MAWLRSKMTKKYITVFDEFGYLTENQLDKIRELVEVMDPTIIVISTPTRHEPLREVEYAGSPILGLAESGKESPPDPIGDRNDGATSYFGEIMPIRREARKKKELSGEK